MKIFEANISSVTYTFLKHCVNSNSSPQAANDKIFDKCGIKTFFKNTDDFYAFSETINAKNMETFEEPDRAEYGDFQTNLNLANRVANLLASREISPKVVIEPTCGKGSFIIATLSSFKTIENVYGIEIYRPYIWEAKFNILDYFLSNPGASKPEIIIEHFSVFDFDFKNLAKQFSSKQVLIIGNPPWVTNSKLGSISSNNLPKKSNFKNHNGLDAITGKGNFDIAEYITILLLEAFQSNNGFLALLVKNTVIKNLVFEQKTRLFQIGSLEKYNIDSKKEFNVSVNAALFHCQLNSDYKVDCSEYDLYKKDYQLKFGWFDEKFVSNISDYLETKEIDNICPFVWRQGIKHDCSSVMEIERTGDHFKNKLSEVVRIEEDLVFGFLKSSDLKYSIAKAPRKYTIITQKKVGQETSYIQHLYPGTFDYLKKHVSYFANRKSSIYRGKPQFSIFGVGDYSFKPFKVAISGLYKTFHFTLVLPQNDKPVMLDDTCYFIGFEKLEYAVYSWILLNSEISKEFLKSITFSDAKRVFTKDILMRLDMLKLAQVIPQEVIDTQLKFINNEYLLKVSRSEWDNFLNGMAPSEEKQLSIFG